MAQARRDLAQAESGALPASFEETGPFERQLMGQLQVAQAELLTFLVSFSEGGGSPDGSTSETLADPSELMSLAEVATTARELCLRLRAAWHAALDALDARTQARIDAADAAERAAAEGVGRCEARLAELADPTLPRAKSGPEADQSSEWHGGLDELQGGLEELQGAMDAARQLAGFGRAELAELERAGRRILRSEEDASRAHAFVVH